MDESSLVEVSAELVSGLIENGKVEASDVKSVYQDIFQVVLASYRQEIEAKKELGVFELFSADDLGEFRESPDEIFGIPGTPEDHTRFD